MLLYAALNQKGQRKETRTDHTLLELPRARRLYGYQPSHKIACITSARRCMQPGPATQLSSLAKIWRRRWTDRSVTSSRPYSCTLCRRVTSVLIARMSQPAANAVANLLSKVARYSVLLGIGGSAVQASLYTGASSRVACTSLCLRRVGRLQLLRGR